MSVTILTGYFRIAVSKISGLIEALPICSAYLNPNTFGSSIPKTIVRKETTKTAANEERNFEYWLKNKMSEPVSKGFIICKDTINASTDAAMSEMFVEICIVPKNAFALSFIDSKRGKVLSFCSRSSSSFCEPKEAIATSAADRYPAKKIKIKKKIISKS
jgi:hypothetical protein